MKKFDFHMHTNYSRCSNLDPGVLVERALKKGLNSVCVTDHDTTRGAVEARNYQEKHNLPIKVELGIEPTTNLGEVLINLLSPEECGLFEKKLKYENGVCSFPVLHEIIMYLREQKSNILVGGNHLFSLERLFLILAFVRPIILAIHL